MISVGLNHNYAVQPITNHVDDSLNSKEEIFGKGRKKHILFQSVKQKTSIFQC